MSDCSQNLMSYFELKVSINKTIKSFQEAMLQEQKESA